MKAIYHLCKTVLFLYLRDPVTVLLSIVLLVLMMLLFGMTTGDEQFKVTSPIAILDESGQGQELYKAIAGDEFLSAHFVNSEAAMSEAIRTAQAAVGLVIERGYKPQRRPIEATGGEVRLVESHEPNRWTRLAEQRLARILAGQSQDPQWAVLITRRNFDVISNRYIDFIFPGVLSLAILQTCLSSATVLLHAKKLGVLRNLQTTPLTPLQLFGGFFFGRCLIIVLHILVLTLTAKLVFHVHIQASPGALLVSILLGVFTFTTMAAVIATISPSFESGVLITQLLNFPMSFLCGVFIKMDSLPSAVRLLADALPLTYLVNIMRGLINRGTPLSKMTMDTTVLSIWFVVSLIAFVWLSWLRRFKTN